MVQCMEAEISKLRRRKRILASDPPAVAETFRRYRLAKDEVLEQKQLMIKQMSKRKKDALDAIAAKDAAVADLKKTKRAIRDIESSRARKAAVKTFTLDAMGQCCPRAGGAKAKHEALRSA